MLSQYNSAPDVLILTFCFCNRSMRLILTRWSGRGVGRELQRLITLLEAGTAERAQYEVCSNAIEFEALISID